MPSRRRTSASAVEQVAAHDGLPASVATAGVELAGRRQS